jgi:hypothetical protein
MWTVHMDEKKTKTGVSFSRESAIFNAMRAIDKALERNPKMTRKFGCWALSIRP